MKKHEQSGGLMIARTHADIVAALSDEEAGRILKGLIYEFWGYGENAAVSESPVSNAVYNSVLQTAKEIDSNYQAQRAQKREAGRKSAKVRTALNGVDECSNGVEECSNGVEECSNGVELNKSKSKEKKSKENKSNENKVSENKSVTPPSAVLTYEKRRILIDKFGEAAVNACEERFERWKASKRVFNGDAFTTMSKWLQEDTPKDKYKDKSGHESDGFGSPLAEEVERAVAEKYKKLLE